MTSVSEGGVTGKPAGRLRFCLEVHFRAFLPGEAPVAQRPEDGDEGAAFFGETIGRVFGAVGCGDLFDYLVLEEAGETFGKDVGRNALRRGGELLEAFGAEHEVAHDEEGPAIPEEIEGAGDGAGGAAVGMRGGGGHDETVTAGNNTCNRQVSLLSKRKYEDHLP